MLSTEYSFLCLPEKRGFPRHPYIYHTLHSFPPGQMHRCKYLAVALTKDALQVTGVCCTFFSKEDSQYLSAPVLSSSVTPFLLSATPLSSLTVNWLWVGWMQRAQKQKSPGNKVLLNHRGLLPPLHFSCKLHPCACRPLLTPRCEVSEG